MDKRSLSRFSKADAGRADVGADVIAYLRAQDDLVAVYLFGSRARGTGSQRSDLDLAVLLDPAKVEDSLERRLQLIEDTEDVVGSPVDVVVLNEAPVVLRHQVLRDGVLLLERDAARRIEFEVQTGKLYCDSGWTRRHFLESLRREVENGGLGGRE